MTYAERLDEAMKAASVSPSSLAKKLGVTYQAVSKVLKGTSGAFTAAIQSGLTFRNAAAAVLLSPLAVDLARAFDTLPQEQRQNLHAHLMYTIELARSPHRPAGASVPLPTEQPPRHR